MKNIDPLLSAFPLDELPDSSFPPRMRQNAFTSTTIRGVEHEDENGGHLFSIDGETETFMDHFSLFQRLVSRCFVDLMWRASKRWVNWNPSMTIKVCSIVKSNSAVLRW